MSFTTERQPNHDRAAAARKARTLPNDVRKVLQLAFTALHRSAPIDSVKRVYPDAHAMHSEAHRAVRELLDIYAVHALMQGNDKPEEVTKELST